MLNLSEVTQNRIAVLKASGTITKEEVEHIEPLIEGAISHGEPLNFYIELMDFSGMELSALKEDVTFDFKHKDHYGKIAIVGESKWQDWATRFCDIVFDAPMQYFDHTQSDEAWQWLNN
ncbi:STAS/SEC14 domain-containing protein [Spongiibacter sp. KMU-158]|uniref:STAS/SEC14 domain-containing protein n=1 Tax=Spongiibacter pelagi TaxID=2760804 RepID=A0A927C107_9GAMM|nr:STAS/SEC14 domain-containing protein [Spongiibacter pelagi]MBD2859274.1 STAS/SEC14 domain-containing protein [Spongiibacter pelagi]